MSDRALKILPLGISDYKKIIENNYYYVDKTLLIEEIETSGNEVLLITRPRRFGKTLNLSMLQYFYQISEKKHDYLFFHKHIWLKEKYQPLQGKFPLIFLSFKDIKASSWAECKELFAFYISQEFNRHYHVLEKLKPHQQKLFLSLVSKEASEAEMKTSLLFLSDLLYHHYNKQVMVLIDEYDTPIVSAYYHGYYQELIDFLRILLPSVLKDNLFLHRAIVTGIIRTGKEGIFSGLNNLGVYSLANHRLFDKFGFTQAEVSVMLHDNNLHCEDEMRVWYNGYQCDNAFIYNPWSIISCCKNNGKTQPYWVNTSDNLLIKKLIGSASDATKIELEIVLSGNALMKEIDDAVVFNNLNDSNIWNILFHAGYLTTIHREIIRDIEYHALMIPNKEIKLLYQKLIKSLCIESLGSIKFDIFLNALVTGQTALFSELLQEFIIQSMSMYDIPSSEPERSYHLFVLGLLLSLTDTHEITSNRESGYGRYDIMIIPKDRSKLGIIIEFKKVLEHRSETFEEAAHKALQQIADKNYVQEMYAKNIYSIKTLGIACLGKKIFVLENDLIAHSR